MPFMPAFYPRVLCAVGDVADGAAPRSRHNASPRWRCWRSSAWARVLFRPCGRFAPIQQ